MEKHELDELQAYINKYFKNKKIITMPTQEFFVITSNSTGEFVKELDENNEPVFTTDPNEAAWDFDVEIVNRFIEDFELQGVKAQPGEGGNHPPKPRISA